MKASRLTKLLALGAAGVAACGQGLTDSASRHSRVVLDVRSLLGAVLDGDFRSVVDTAHLTIASGGEERTLTQVLGPGDDETTFDVTVDAGTARFSVDVISNNGTPLYRGETSATIEADGFAVSITPQAINPVMVVLPRRATFDTTTFTSGNAVLRVYGAIVRVRNPGLDTLKWRVDSLVPRPPGVAFSCSVLPSQDDNCLHQLDWTARTEADILLTFTMLSSVVFQPPQSIRFLSNVGTITAATVP
jgi:hypothetical protein